MNKKLAISIIAICALITVGAIYSSSKNKKPANLIFAITKIADGIIVMEKQLQYQD